MTLCLSGCGVVCIGVGWMEAVDENRLSGVGGGWVGGMEDGWGWWKEGPKLVVDGHSGHMEQTTAVYHEVID